MFLLASSVFAACSGAPVVPSTSATGATVRVERAVAWGLASARSVSLGLSATAVSNEGDALDSVSSPGAKAMLHQTESGGGMAAVGVLEAPPAGSLRLGPGRSHVMINQIDHAFAVGDSIDVTLHWRRGGSMHLRVPIVRFGDAANLLDAP